MTKEELSFKLPFAIGIALGSIATETTHALILVLLAIMGLDYFTGILRGLLTRSLNSTIGLKGIIKKIAMLVVVGVAACIEIVLMVLGMSAEGYMVVAAICFFIVNEAISCLENAGQLGVPVPAVLLDALEKLREVGGKEQKVSRRRKTKKEEN